MKRIDAIDVTKGIAILCIVFGHAAPDSALRYVLYSFHVPLFFILAGLTYKNKNDKKAFVLGKVRRLLVPYYSFSIISILIYFIMAKVISLPGDTRIIPNVLGMLYANSNSDYMTWNRPLWFLPCLFSTTIIVDLFETLLRKYKNKLSNIYRWFFVLFAWGCGIAVNVNVARCFLPFHLESAVFLSGFYEVGIILSNTEIRNGLIQKIRERKMDYWCLIAAAFIFAGTLVFYTNGATDISIHGFGRYPICLILTSLLFSMGIMIASVKIEDCKWLAYIGRSSLAILVMHKFPILFFQEMVPVVKVWLKNTDSFMGGICGLAVTMITVILCLIAEKAVDKLFPWMLGKSRVESGRGGKTV